MRWLQGVLMFVISAGLLVLTAQLVGIQTLLAGGAVLTPWTVVFALACGLVATGSQAVRWRLLLKVRGTTLSWGRALADCYSSSLVNMILPGGLGGDFARVAVYRNTGQRKWWSPLAAVGAERLSATALLFTTATAALAPVSVPFAAVTGTVAVGALGFSVFGMRKMAVRTALVVWLTAAASLGSLLVLYLMVMVQLGGPAIPVLAVVGLASMSLPIGVGGWGVRELSVSVVAASAATSVHDAVSAATGYGVLAIISVLPGAVTLSGAMLARRRRSHTAQPSAVQPD